MEKLKQLAAKAALDYIENYIEDNTVIGVGTGSTVNYFIDALATVKNHIEAAVASSKETAKRLQAHHIQVVDLNILGEIPLYVDGADEINQYLQMIKGGGGALTGEKIIANNSKKFICIADQTKYVEILGKHPVAVEVIPMARSYVARKMVGLGGEPIYRQGFKTDYGNTILDVHNLDITDPEKLENTLNNIVGVVTNGIFAKRPADLLLLGTEKGVKIFKK